GGASALLPAPAASLRLEDKVRTTDLLLRAGASIHELNAVRKHLSRLKGGGLARTAAPARVLALVLSDVVGDDLSTIASGPAAPRAPPLPIPRRTATRSLSSARAASWPTCPPPSSAISRPASAARSPRRPSPATLSSPARARGSWAATG